MAQQNKNVKGVKMMGSIKMYDQYVHHIFSSLIVSSALSLFAGEKVNFQKSLHGKMGNFLLTEEKMIRTWGRALLQSMSKNE